MASEIGDSIYLQISVRNIVEGMRDRVLTTQFAPWRASAQLWIYLLDRVEPRLAAVDSILVAATEELVSEQSRPKSIGSLSALWHRALP